MGDDVEPWLPTVAISRHVSDPGAWLVALAMERTMENFRGRAGEHDEFANPCAYVVSEQAAYIQRPPSMVKHAPLSCKVRGCFRLYRA